MRSKYGLKPRREKINFSDLQRLENSKKNVFALLRSLQ